MSIVFVDPPSPPGFVAFRDSHGGFGECCRTSRLKFPTLDIFHNATLLLERGLEAAVVDSVLCDHTPEQCIAAVMAKRPSMVVMRTCSGSQPHDVQVARELRRHCSAPVVFYGPQVDGAQGPRTFDPDAMPIPRWDLVDYRRYSYVTTQTSWGCPFGCGYCPYPVTQGTRWRARSIQSVVREFEALRRRYGLRFVLLRDPEFSLRRQRTAALCRAVIAAGTPLMWGCETRLDTLDDELLDLMAEAGCIRIAFGVESINPAALRLMGRRAMSPESIRARVASLKSRGMLTYAMYLIGLPAETEETTRRLIDFALELDTDAASFSMATPFPGTALEKLARRRGYMVASDPLHLTSCVPSMRNARLSAAQVERLYLTAKTAWKERRREKAQSALSSPL